MATQKTCKETKTLVHNDLGNCDEVENLDKNVPHDGEWQTY